MSLRDVFAAALALTISFVGSVHAETTSITFLHLNDLHAHLVSSKEMVRTRDGNAQVVEHGGVARMATLIGQIRTQNPNSVLMNIGDTFHGGVEALYSEGNDIATVVNELGIDVGVPGNWDFAYGPGNSRIRYTDDTAEEAEKELGSQWIGNKDVTKAAFPNLGGNVTYSSPRSKRGDYFLPPTMTMQFGDVKVGFIGITSDIVPRMYRLLAMGLSFLEGYDAYHDYVTRHAMALRAAGADVVVVMSELGIQKDYRLATDINEGLVDVFFSAHTHEVTERALVSKSGALVVEAGNHGYLGQMDITVTDGVVTDANWALHQITNDIPEDAYIASLVDQVRAPYLDPDVNIETPSTFTTQYLTMPIDAVVGHTDTRIHRKHALESSFNNAYTQLLRSYTNTELAMTPGFRFDNVIGEALEEYQDDAVIDHDITVEDIYRFFPMSFSLGTAEITGANLRSMIEDMLANVFSPNAFRQGGGWLDGFSGIQVDIDLTGADGARVLDLRDENGNPIDPDKRYTITGCLRPFERAGVLCSFPNFENVAEMQHPNLGIPLTVVDGIILSLQNNGLQMPAGDNTKITDVSNTPQWPESRFVQPLEGVGQVQDDSGSTTSTTSRRSRR